MIGGNNVVAQALHKLHSRQFSAPIGLGRHRIHQRLQLLILRLMLDVVQIKMFALHDGLIIQVDLELIRK